MASTDAPRAQSSGVLYSAGLLDWLKNTLVAEGMAGISDLDLIQLIAQT